MLKMLNKHIKHLVFFADMVAIDQLRKLSDKVNMNIFKNCNERVLVEMEWAM
jgi:hypothetical protein